MNARVLLVGPALVFLLYGWTLGGTFLSDDFLLNLGLDEPAAGGDSPAAMPGVAWGEIFADFWRGWAGQEGSVLYRPLVSLTTALTYAVFGADPFWFHLGNVLMHAIAAAACGLLCARCAPNRPTLAALIGATIFALHPAGADAACWIAARTSGLAEMFGLLAFASFARESGSARLPTATLGFSILALLSKESAVVLPVACIFVDLLVRGPAPRPGRRRQYLLLFTLAAAYLLLRAILFGTLFGGPAAPGAALLANSRLEAAAGKLQILFAPVGNSLPPPWAALTLIALAAALLLLLLPPLLASHRRRRQRDTGEAPIRPHCGFGPRGVLLITLLWILVTLAPSHQLGVSPADMTGARMVYPATTALAVGAAALVARARYAWTGRAALALLLGGLGTLGIARMRQYLDTFDEMRALQTDLARHAATADVAAPLAMVVVAPPPLGVPFLNCNALFGLAEKPIADRDTPLVGLGFVWEEVPHSEHLRFDPIAMRAMREGGASLLTWTSRADARRFVVDRRRPAPAPDANTLPSLRPHVDRPGWFLLEGTVDTWDVEGLELEWGSSAGGGRVEWLYHGPEGPAEYRVLAIPDYVRDAPGHVVFTAPERGPDGRFLARADLSHSLTFLAQRMLGGLKGFRIISASAGDPPILGLRLVSRSTPLPLLPGEEDVELPFAEFEHLLPLPALPAGAQTMQAYLVGPDTTLTAPVHETPRRRIVLAPGDRRAMAAIRRVSRQDRWYLFVEARGDRVWRSETRAFRLRD